MLCADFEDRLTDYLEGALDAESHRAFAEHALRCPVCHELLSEVKNSLEMCRTAEVPPPPAELEARILIETMPETAMTCEEFEEHLTDYLDGFLPATLYHRWERHAALCESCTELPGQVVRSIGACYTYISEERPVPAGLHERILQATLGTTTAEEMRAPFTARLAARLREWLDPLVSPQFATVATMLLVAVLVLTSTVSADGSISGMYRASVKLAEQTYAQGANQAVKGANIPGDFKQIADGITAAFMEKSESKDASGTKEQTTDGAAGQQPGQQPPQQQQR
jgi:anti-sigma factor RsiW